MGIDGGDAVLNELQHAAAGLGVLVDGHHLIPEDQGVVGHDEVSLQGDGLVDDGAEGVQGHENFLDLALPAAAEQTAVVPAFHHIGRGDALNKIQNIGNGCHT